LQIKISQNFFRRIKNKYPSDGNEMKYWQCALLVAGISSAHPIVAFSQHLSLRNFQSYHRCIRRSSNFLQLPHSRGGGPQFLKSHMSTTSVTGSEKSSDEISAKSSEAAEAAADKEDKMKVLVMYVILRRDLKWPLGSVVAQGAHASTAVLWEVFAILIQPVSCHSLRIVTGRHGMRKTC
jgi:hypothetical protein